MKGAISIFTISLILFFAGLIYYKQWLPKYKFQKEMRALALMSHKFIISLEKYYLKHLEYPMQIEQLIEEGFLQSMPENPLAGSPVKNSLPRMAKAGDISYFPVIFRELRTVQIYHLFVYSSYEGCDYFINESIDYAFLMENGISVEPEKNHLPHEYFYPDGKPDRVLFWFSNEHDPLCEKYRDIKLYGISPLFR